MSAEPEPPVPRLPLPPDGGACGVVFAALFVGFFVALAVYNLIAFGTVPMCACGTVASAVWLTLVAYCLALALWQVGLWGSVVALLGPFSHRQFVDARHTDDGTVIGFGYQLFGRRFYYLRVTTDRITSVDMSSGQGTALAGRDMNDWSVALWYRDPTALARVLWPGSPSDEVYIVGPARAREETAELLAVVVAFLRAAGCDLQPGESETEFRHDRGDSDGRG